MWAISGWKVGDGRYSTDAGETAVHVGAAAISGPGYFRRGAIAPQSGENVQRHGHDAERYEEDTRISPLSIQNILFAIYVYNHDRHQAFGNGETMIITSELTMCCPWPV